MSTRRVYQIAESRLAIDFGSVLGIPAEVIVSSDDYRLTMSGGVSAGIGAAAGNALLLDAAKAVPREAGDVVVTTAGALASRYVFHVITIGPEHWTDPPTDEDIAGLVRHATRACLELMPPLGVRSIAFPRPARRAVAGQALGPSRRPAHRRHISGWHDGQIVAGQEWEPEIIQRLDGADIILLLVTSSFLGSEFIGQVELTRALGRHRRGEAVVIPVILGPADWTSTGLAGLQALPKDGKAVSTWPDHDSAYLDIAQGLRRAVDAWRASEP